MKSARVKGSKGFTLVELLVVAGMMGVVMTAIYSLYRTQQRAVNVQDDVVEVQQNLRIALDSITKDIRMSGFFIPGGTNPALLPVTAWSNNTGPGQTLDPVTGKLIPAASDTLTLNTLSSSNALALAWIDLSASVIPEPNKQTGVATPFIVDSSETVDRFTAGAGTAGDMVKIIRPENMGGDGTDSLKQLYRVIAKNSAARSITLQQIPQAGVASAANWDFKTGDVIVKVPQTVPQVGPDYYCKVMYSLATNAGVAGCPVGTLCLVRTENNVPAVVATNITNLQFTYVKKGIAALQGSDDPTPTGVTTDDQVRAIKVTLTGLTNASVTAASEGMSSNQVKTRTLSSVVRLMNKK